MSEFVRPELRNNLEMAEEDMEYEEVLELEEEDAYYEEEEMAPEEENMEPEYPEQNPQRASSANMMSQINNPPIPFGNLAFPPVFNHVQVSNSQNVHLGNNVYFNGPVVIKQMPLAKNQDNDGYVQTEDDAPSQRYKIPAANVSEEKMKPSATLWIKLALFGIGLVILVCLCAVLTVSLSDVTHTNSTGNPHLSTSHRIVVEVLDKLQMLSVAGAVLAGTYALWTPRALTNPGAGPVALGEPTQPAEEEDSAEVPFLSPLRMVSRTEWLAQPVERPLELLSRPVPWVVIQHTATEPCHTQSECVLAVRLIQTFHVESRGWHDIAYNFLVGGDGAVYTGRGWRHRGAHTLGYNEYSVGIAFIGTFNNVAPPPKQLSACRALLQRGVAEGHLARQYRLLAHRQLASTLSPGDALVAELQTWPHYAHNVSTIDDLVPEN